MLSISVFAVHVWYCEFLTFFVRLPVVYKSNIFFLVEANYRAGYFHIDPANGHEVKPEDIHVTFNDVKGVSFRIDVNSHSSSLLCSMAYN